MGQMLSLLVARHSTGDVKKRLEEQMDQALSDGDQELCIMLIEAMYDLLDLKFEWRMTDL